MKLSEQYLEYAKFLNELKENGYSDSYLLYKLYEKFGLETRAAKLVLGNWERRRKEVN